MFSCVVTNITKDITQEDVERGLIDNSIMFTKCWRIKSRATGLDTNLFRVITNSKSSVDNQQLSYKCPNRPTVSENINNTANYKCVDLSDT